MLTILFQRNEFTWLKSRALQARDWHRLVALLVLYLIASAIAPAFGI
ncbi:hypothetical protein [Burkholderia cenocepacia]|nr:hypothetical protein [Burkholderia cenocepacia]MBR7987992.1 hypothetical protein [Burkholderia cenocepacia]MBR8309509.1 hypothetical protein [Burkholderia cenocepacia]MCA7966337.1 hypothetical protein [Burkholderia cenocepacia]MDR8058075.1 hypothetical protein [Burkholderia cenocepacia]MDR8061835.1 hypothetical protein [Burkholderia cenocepacia]